MTAFTTVRSEQTPPDREPRPEFLPFAIPSIGDEEIAEVAKSLSSGWITTGPKVKQFEDAIAQFVDASHAVAVSSCTAGLHLSLHALGVGPGDEVIVPTMTFCSTANVVEHLGARPVLVDIGHDFNITPDAIRDAISPNTKAIVPVHFAGQAIDMEAIYKIADEHNLPIVEDAAHGIGAKYKGHRIGADALATDFPNVQRTVVFSFYATKNMTTGEGGMVVTTDPDLAANLRVLSLHGMSRDAWKRYTSTGSWYYEVITPGFKANMTDIQAAIGIHQLNKLDTFLNQRRHQAARYNRLFADNSQVQTPHVLPGREHAYHLYVLKLRLDQLTIDRSQFIDLLRDHNIGTSVHFIPVHLHPYYRDAYGHERGDLPTAEHTYDQIVSIPLYPGLTDHDIDYVADAINHITTAHCR